MVEQRRWSFKEMARQLSGVLSEEELSEEERPEFLRIRRDLRAQRKGIERKDGRVVGWFLCYKGGGAQSGHHLIPYGPGLIHRRLPTTETINIDGVECVVVAYVMAVDV